MHISPLTLSFKSNSKLFATKSLSRSLFLSKMSSVDGLLIHLIFWCPHKCSEGRTETGRTKSSFHFFFFFFLWVKLTGLLSHTIMNGTKEYGGQGESPPNYLLGCFRRKDYITHQILARKPPVDISKKLWQKMSTP